MEASYATELQCAGQHKRDTVASDSAYCVQVEKYMVKGRSEGMEHDDGSYNLQNC